MKKILTLALLLIIVNVSFAKEGPFDEKSTTGKIVGKVLDKATNETMIGLAVTIEGTTKAAPTNIEGRYELVSLTPGVYKLSLKYIGYQPKLIEGVVVKAGQITNLDVIMEEASTTTKEVVITSSFKQESIGALYTIQKNNVSVSDGISSDVIKRSPDKSTSEVLKRVSGTSVQDNKFVIIRGLSDRYNFSMLNNTPLPSTEADKRAFSFDIIPANLVDNIVINKTASADLPSDFAGGVINISTKDFPEETFLNVGLGTSYNSISTGKNYKIGERAQDFPNMVDRKTYLKMTANEQAEESLKFRNNWGFDQKTAMPNFNGQLSFGTSRKINENSKIGVIASYTGRTSENIVTADRSEYENRTLKEKAYTFKDTVAKTNTTHAGLLNLSYIINQNNKLSVKNIVNYSNDVASTTRDGAYTTDRYSLIKSFSTYTLNRLLTSSQVEGNHNIGAGAVKLAWNFGYSKIDRNEPDWRNLEYAKNIDDAADASVPYRAALGVSLNKNSGFTYFSKLNEDIYSGGVNATFDLKNEEGKTSNQLVKVGVYKQYRERQYTARGVGYKTGFKYAANGGEEITAGAAKDLFTPENIKNQTFVIDDITKSFDIYNASSSVDAAYVMLDNKLFSKLRLSYGFRVENFKQGLNTTEANEKALKVRTEKLSLLPSVNATYELSPKVNLRAAYSKTVSRPEFREVSPLNVFDFSTSFSFNGNPALKPSNTENYDAKIEFYPTGSQLISIGAFKKVFFNPIEAIVDRGSSLSSRTFSYTNAPKADNVGIEAEFRIRLDFLKNEALENFTIFANGAMIKSEVKLDEKNKRPMQGQSPFLFNGGLQYSTKSNTFSVSLLYNRIGDRIATVGNPDIYDYYEKGRDVVDLQLALRPFKGFDAKLNLGDLLAQTAVLYQDTNGDKKYESGKDRDIVVSKLGYNVSLGLSYNF